jgi:hypothetical protein
MGKDNSIWEKRKRKAALTLECPPVVGHLPCLWQDSMSKLSSKQECLFSQQTRMSAVLVQRTFLCAEMSGRTGISSFQQTRMSVVLFFQQTGMSAVQVQRTLLCFTFDVGMSFFHRTIPSQNDIAKLFDWKRTV